MKIKSFFAALGALVLLAGCGQVATDSSSPALGMNETMFVQMMVPHHEQAIQMAELAPSRTDTPEVLALAEKIKSGQEPEIELMQSWLGDDAAQGGDHAVHGGMGGMDGMLTEEELAALEASSGRDFDKLFLAAMIKHHEGAIDMLSLLDSSEDAKVLELRDQIEAVQLDEIAQMKALLANY